MSIFLPFFLICPKRKELQDYSCFSPENIFINLTIPQAKIAYTMIATNTEGSKIEVVSAMSVTPLLNIPSNGRIKILVKS